MRDTIRPDWELDRNHAGASRHLYWRQERGVDLDTCLVGLMTFLTAARHHPDAAVAYHGSETEKYVDEAHGISTPLLMHLGEEDEFIGKNAQAQIKSALAEVRGATVFSYPNCHHAFSRHNGAHYDAQAAALAKERADAFLRQHLTRPS